MNCIDCGKFVLNKGKSNPTLRCVKCKRAHISAKGRLAYERKIKEMLGYVPSKISN